MSSFVKANRGLSLAIAAMTVVSVAAVAQTTGSPFAPKKKKQAWETDAVRPDATTPQYQAPSYSPQSYQSPQNSAPEYIPPPNYAPPSAQNNFPPPSAGPSPAVRSSAVPPSGAESRFTPQTYTAPATAAPTPKSNYNAQTYSAPQAGPMQSSESYGSYQPQTHNNNVVAPDLLPGFRPRATGQAGAYYPGRVDKGGFSVPAYAPRGQTGAYSGGHNTSPYTHNAYQGGSIKSPQTGAPPYGNPNTRPQYAGPNAPSQYGQQSWKDRLGLGNLLTSFSAALKVGVAAVQRKNTLEDTDWNAGFIADGKVSGEVSAITRGGLEYGIGGEVRGQYDKYRRGFGGKVGDCGTTSLDNISGCQTITVDGLVRPLRGHTSQFYSAGLDNAKAEEFAVEGAYLFLRSAYGDVTLGRDDGAAYLFSLGAPTLLAVNASNSPVDYTGLDSVRTVNEASGFSEKIAYVSPRLLGDQIGLGVQFGASYAPNARACGVDYCVRSNGKDGSTALSPDLKNVIEFGLALDRTFSNGLSIEGTATYATATEDSDIVFPNSQGFDDLKSFGLGLEAEYGPWTLGGSFLNSNNGLLNGDYEAYDIGLTFKPAQWGVSASYGHATDKNVNLMSDQATLGFVYDFDRFTLGTGVQYIERDVVGVAGGLLAPRTEKATALFIEGGVKF